MRSSFFEDCESRIATRTVLVTSSNLQDAARGTRPFPGSISSLHEGCGWQWLLCLCGMELRCDDRKQVRMKLTTDETGKRARNAYSMISRNDFRNRLCHDSCAYIVVLEGASHSGKP